MTVSTCDSSFNDCDLFIDLGVTSVTVTFILTFVTSLTVTVQYPITTVDTFGPWNVTGMSLQGVHEEDWLQVKDGPFCLRVQGNPH